jgi:hypothetical protein
LGTGTTPAFGQFHPRAGMEIPIQTCSVTTHTLQNDQSYISTFQTIRFKKETSKSVITEYKKKHSYVSEAESLITGAPSEA